MNTLKMMAVGIGVFIGYFAIVLAIEHCAPSGPDLHLEDQPGK